MLRTKMKLLKTLKLGYRASPASATISHHVTWYSGECLTYYKTDNSGVWFIDIVDDIGVSDYKSLPQLLDEKVMEHKQ
jgi:hypothetical protein